MDDGKRFLLVSAVFLAYEAIVISTPWLPPFLDVLSWFLLFSALAAAGYFMLGRLTGSWFALAVALVPLMTMVATGFDGPFAGYSDPEATVASMKESWAWLTAFLFLPAVGLGKLLSSGSGRLADQAR